MATRSTSSPGESLQQRSLAGYRPRGHRGGHNRATQRSMQAAHGSPKETENPDVVLHSQENRGWGKPSQRNTAARHRNFLERHHGSHRPIFNIHDVRSQTSEPSHKPKGRTGCPTSLTGKFDLPTCGCLLWIISTCKSVWRNLICGNWITCLPPSCEKVREIHLTAFYPLSIAEVGDFF